MSICRIVSCRKQQEEAFASTAFSRPGSERLLPVPKPQKMRLCDRRFESNEKVDWETEGYFGGFDKLYYLESIEKLNDRILKVH